MPGYTYDTSIPVIARLIHFTDKSVLLEGGTATATSSSELENTASRNIETTLSNVNEKTTAAPFYSYANDWSNDSSLETYIELFIPLKNNTTQITNTYRYKIAVTPKGLTGDDAKYMTNLYRNHLYDIDVIIKILGGLDEPPVDVSGNYTIRDWGTQEILIDIKGSHFLVVSETNIVMPNISTYQLTFNSSIPNVTLVSGSFKATYTYVNVNNGQYVTVNITDGSQFPSVVVQNGVASGTISIQSTIPLNFIPKDITFSITNTQLTETIKIQQLPPTYFSVEKGNRSNLREVLDEAHTNPYMYTITTLAPSGDIIWGFPPVDANGNTSNSAEVANMVSPKFMMASQMGATDVMGYNSGVTNCQNYWEETTKNGGAVTYSDWRLPTEAEIKYIDDLQHNSYNPQGVVMRGNYYWDAYNGNGAYLMKAPITSSGNSNSAHVRCIRDIKD